MTTMVAETMTTTTIVRRSFNFARAWREIAEPAFRSLPAGVLALLADVTTAYSDVHQQSNLEMPWLDGFHDRFEAIDTATLARASRAVYYFGHWSPNGEVSRTAGATWKFSNLCDQILTERLWPGMPHIRPHGDSGKSPVSYKVLEGALRLQLSRSDYWMWREIGYASAELLEALRATNPHANESPDVELDRVESSPEVTMLTASDALPATPWFGLLHAGENYMDEQFPCIKCGSSDPSKYSYGMFFASELCVRGECARDCTCYLLDVDHHVLRAELLRDKATRLEECDGEVLRRAVHELRMKNGKKGEQQS